MRSTALEPSLRWRQIIFACFIALICISLLAAILQNRAWTVPDNAKKIQNPVPPSESALSAAKPLYTNYCEQCHGATGQGDGPDAKAHWPSPTALTDAGREGALSDGELFYKISVGRRPMPAFKKRLTEQQRWQLVLLIRSFGRKSFP